MKKQMKLWITAGVTLFALLAVVVVVLVKRYAPSNERVNLAKYFALDSKSDVAIVLEDERLDKSDNAMLADGHVYVRYDVLHDAIDGRYYWDESESKLLYTTPQDTFWVESGTDNYYKGRKKVAGEFGEIVKLHGNEIWVNFSYVALNSNLQYHFYKKPNRLVVFNETKKIEQVETTKDTEIRLRGGVKSPILSDVMSGTKLTVLKKYDNWYQVSSKDGFQGFVKSSKVSDSKKTTRKIKMKWEYNHCMKDDRIEMAWHQVTSVFANTQIANVLAKTKGLTVVSPTWFYLVDNKGGIGSLASADYVTYCHAHDIEVWGLVSNLVAKGVDTGKVLEKTTYRENLVSALIAKAIEYKLDGINVDIESLKPEFGDAYIQFIRELSLKCHANDLILSVDNYVPSAYTSFYNRSEQARYADYIITMAYDEHYAGSDAGSVSSLGYVKEATTNVLKEVPADQAIIALPFYTRLWELTPKKGSKSKYTTSSQAIGMTQADNLASVNGVTPTWDASLGQDFVEYEQNGKKYQIWFENAKSLEEKLKVVTKNNVAGVSFWKLGFENEAAWNMVIKYSN
ncbi:MAG: glycosyl hydrolase family 18 [Lachnospiraceae bacterium]|jgi:spore germination protein YaaH|nr:glycosyl hydrolase family 18 [Lachnospiraceae bacterium]